LNNENNKLGICIIRDYAKQYTEKSFYIMLKNAVLKIISGSKSWNSPAFINQSLEMLIDIYKGHYKDSQARCTRYNIMWKSLSVTCGSSVVFFSGSPVSSTNKTDHHDITEILLKVGLNTIPPTQFSTKIIY
jgi:hypothetical protein